MSVLARASVVLTTDVAQFHAGLASAEEALESAGRRMSQAGQQLTMRFTVPVVAAGGAAVRMASQFDNSMRKTAATTSLGVEATDALRESVRAVGKEFGVSGKDAAEGLFFIATPALNAAQTMEVLRESLKGAAVGLGEANVIANGAVGAMNAYAKSGLTASRAVEILAAGIKFGKFESQELIPVLGRLTGLASSMGISFESLIGTMSVLTLTGANTAEASTMISAAMSMMLGTTEEGEKLLGQFGLKLEDLRRIAAGPQGLIGVFRKLDEATGGNVEQLETLFPNIRALRGVMIALSQDATIVDNAMRGVKDSVGFLDKAFAIFAAAPAFQMKKALAEVTDALIEVGNVLIPVVVPALRAVADMVNNAAKAFSRLNPDTQNLVISFVAITAALGPLLMLLGGLVQTIALLKMSGLIASFGMLGGLLVPFGIALGVITAHWMAMRLEINRVEKATKDANAQMQQMFAQSDPSKAGAKADAMDARLQAMQKKSNELNARLTMLLGLPSATTVGGSIALSKAGFKPGPVADEIEELTTRIEDLGLQIDNLRESRDTLRGVADAFAALPKGGAPGKPGEVVIPPAWVTKAKDAMKAYGEELQRVAQFKVLLGDQFNESAAQIKAMEEVVSELVDAGVPLDAVIGANGESLRILAQRLREAHIAVQGAEEAERSFADTMQRAEAAVQAALTPQQVYEQTMHALVTALNAGRVSLDEFTMAGKRAKAEMEEQLVKSNELGEAIRESFGRASDALVDFAFTGKLSFSDFVRSVLSDLTKLILRMELLKALYPEGGGGVGGFLDRIFGFARGGFLPGGDIGLVGERGPELVMAGRSGVSITPMPALHAQGGGSAAGPLHLTFNVNAIDRKDVARFFEDNEGHVAAAIMKARSKSEALFRSPGGR